MVPCAECGYEYESLDHQQICHEVDALALEHRLLLTSVPSQRLRDHPKPDCWSVLEYGCHVRDVLRFQRDRVILAQTVQTPRFTSMRRDERAIEERYNEQDPSRVAGEVAAAAACFGRELAGLDETGWLRTGLYPWPEPEVRTVEWIGRRTAHELAHHLFDERRLLSLA